MKAQIEIALDLVLTYGLDELLNIDARLLKDKEFIFELVKEYEGNFEDILEYLSDDLRNDINFRQLLANAKYYDVNPSPITTAEEDSTSPSLPYNLKLPITYIPVHTPDETTYSSVICLGYL